MQKPPTVAGSDERSSPVRDWGRFVAGFLEESFAASPPFAVWAGRHEYDGLFPDLSAAGLEAEAGRLQSARREALSFDPASLDAARRFQREHLLAVLDQKLFYRVEAGWPFTHPLFYTMWYTEELLSPDIYLTRGYAPPGEKLRAYTRYARNLPTALAQVRANLRTPLPRTHVETALGVYRGMRTLFSGIVPGIFNGVGDASLQAAFEQANSGAIRAVERTAAWLEDQRGAATNGFALGAELFLRLLRQTERIDLSLEELKARGQADLERNQATLRAACRAYAPSESMQTCIERVTANKPPEGAVRAARRQLRSLKAFLQEQEIVSIPGREEAQVEEAPPHQRWGAAYISAPGPYESGLPSVYYITPPDADWSEAERQAYIPGEADLLFISAHEIWPGHFLQFQHARRCASPFGFLFFSYAFTEGWAHYAEELMWEAGLGEGRPEYHIGMLLNALVRNVRYLAAIGLHTEGMSVAEAERMFRELAWQSPANARQEAARGTFDPGYLNYTLGKLLIRELRQEWLAAPAVGREPGGLRSFHDQLLSYGAPPLPLVRAAMLGRE